MSEVVFDEDWVFMDVIDYEGKEYHVFVHMDEDQYMEDIDTFYDEVIEKNA